MMKWLVIGKGWASWHAETFGCRSTGGSLKEYLKEAEENAFIYDASETGEEFAKFTISGPMLDLSLSAGMVKPFGDIKALEFMLPALGGEFKTIAQLNRAGLSSLDYVAFDVWERLLRQVPNVKFGRVINGEVKWE